MTTDPTTPSTEHEFENNGMGLNICKNCRCYQTVPQFPRFCNKKDVSEKEMRKMEETLKDYIATRLLNADMTSFIINNSNHAESLCTADGCPRLSPCHTLPNTTRTFRNIYQGEVHEFVIEDALVEFYRNSLAAGEPMIADTIICHKSFYVPKLDRYGNVDKTQPILHELRRLTWECEGWFLFSSRTGLLSDKWWHIYGYLPSQRPTHI